MDVELRSLRYFICVAEEENISRAAEKLHIAQPALSRRMSELESELEVSLFVRTGRSIRLTAAGAIFLSQVRDAVAHLDQILNSAKTSDDMPAREFRVGYAPSMSQDLLPHVVKEIRTLFPWITVTLLDLDTDAMITGLKKGDLSAAMMPMITGTSLRGIRYHEIATYKPSVVMAAGHPLASRVELDAAEVAGYPLVMFSRDGYPEHYQLLRAILGNAGKLKIKSECDTVASMLVMIQSGEGISVVREGFERLSPDTIVARPITGASSPVCSFGIAHRSNDEAPELKAFIRLVAEYGASGDYFS